MMKRKIEDTSFPLAVDDDVVDEKSEEGGEEIVEMTLTPLKKPPLKLPRLPEEIWLKILGLLPAKSILRCLTICKKWKFLTSMREFLFHHHSHRALFLKQMILDGEYDVVGEDLSIHPNPENILDYVIVHSPLSDQYKDPKTLHYIGSIDGAICVCAYDPDTFIHIYLWNPSIRRSIRLPNSPLHLQSADKAVGFGCDSQRRHYKVVRVSYYKRTQTWEAEVCSIDNQLWRPVSNTPVVLKDYKGGAHSWSQCCIDGSVLMGLY